MNDDTDFYTKVAQELKEGTIHEGLWLKALVQSDNDTEKAKLEYTKLRVSQLVEEEHRRQKTRFRTTSRKRSYEQPIRTHRTSTRSSRQLVGVLIFLVVMCNVLLILFLTLDPFVFVQFNRVYHLSHYFGGFDFGGYDTCCTDLAFLGPRANFLLFVPLGFGITALIWKKPATWIVAFAIVQLLCFGLSFTVEFLQVFQPWRNASLADVLMNILGSCLGFICFRVWGEALIHRAVNLVLVLRS